MIMLTELATLYEGTPIFSKRVKVSAAELVCNVDNTKCPVCEALMAISAVSKSRISPTITMSGSWRKNERNAPGKVKPARVLICTWLMPSRLISTGSSAVDILRSSVFKIFKPVYSDTVFPEPVGPVTNIIPCGCASASM